MRRLWFRAVLVLVALVGGVLVPGTPARAAGHNPVVFVHGLSSGSWVWNTMIDRFEADGWDGNELFDWEYDWGQSNEVTARQLAAKVDSVLAATGAGKVDLVTHSMGGLSSRHYLKFLGGAGSVDDWVSIGGPNHGTNSAYLCTYTSCDEMRFDSAFLTALNSGDETPGGVHYGTFWSSCDEIINPDGSTKLSGADNNHVGCIGHISLLGSSSVYAQVRDFIR